MLFSFCWQIFFKKNIAKHDFFGIFKSLFRTFTIIFQNRKHMHGYVTVVGRPNVGKSSLFNALTGHKIAIVSDTANTTRDVIEYEVIDREQKIAYYLADSGGLEFGVNDGLLDDVRARVQEAIKRSDLIVFVLEYDKITSVDEEIAKLLRRSGKPVFVIANKADNPQRSLEAYEILRLGFEDFFIASVVQTRGIDIISQAIATKLKTLWIEYTEDEDDGSVKVALIGRPNVGKSSLLNAIMGEEKTIVRDMPGTTRDAVDFEFLWKDQKFRLIDTAGIRRSGKVHPQTIEGWSVLRSERAIERADVAVLVMDAYEGITSQDLHIISFALEAKKGIILVLNKWDLVLAKPGIDKTTIENKYLTYLKEKFDFLSYVTPLFLSAIKGRGAEKVLDIALEINTERHKRISTSPFNDFLEHVTHLHEPTGTRKSHHPKIYFGSQVEVAPPKFVLSVNNPEAFHFSYKRYLENKIREQWGFFGTPLIIEYKKRESIYAKRGGRQEKRSWK